MGTAIKTVTTADLVKALRPVIDKGLPIKEGAAPELLVDLNSVYARSVIPDEPRNRLAALNELLPRLIATIGDPIYRDAVQHLFALAPGTRGTNLTARRRRAARLLKYNESHFREVIERELLEAVAALVQDDLLRYRSRVKRAPESLEPTGDTPRLGPEHLTHQEELASRIWQHVYGLRAELIADARLSGAAGFEAQAEDHRQAAARMSAALQALLSEWTDVFGERFVAHGSAEYGVDAVKRIAAWRP